MRVRIALMLLFAGLLLLAACQPKVGPPPVVFDRLSKIPSDVVKITPAMDAHPPVMHSSEFDAPIPLDAISTAGAEDSPFIPVDSDELYFFFTPDVRVPVEKQLFDGVTGIYVSRFEGGKWQEPRRVVLNDDIGLDGCGFVQGDLMYFCSARAGYTGVRWFKASRVDGVWRDWRNADAELKKDEYETGELHISADGTELYFHSPRAGGKGGTDIWLSRRVAGEWSAPVNVDVVNTEMDEDMPYLTPDGNELWFNRLVGAPELYRSKRVGGVWQAPERMVSSFAGEPTLDRDGNLYFVHHFFKDDKMLEADIYVAYRK